MHCDVERLFSFFLTMHCDLLEMIGLLQVLNATVNKIQVALKAMLNNCQKYVHNLFILTSHYIEIVVCSLIKINKNDHLENGYALSVMNISVISVALEI